MITIRAFRNSDVPALARLWNAHRADAGNPQELSTASIEVIILGRPFFQSENVLVATIAETPVGYVHWMMVPGASGDAVLASIAVPRHLSQDEIAARLMEQATIAVRAQGASRLLLGQAPEQWTGYAGVQGVGMGGGVPDQDQAVRRWADQSGFSPLRQLHTYVIRASAYRPVFDRDLLALRRSAVVNRRRDVTDQPFRIAAAMSHLEVHRFIAHRRNGALLAQADVMVGDAEMLVVSGGLALLSHWESPFADREQALCAIRFVLSTAISELIAERTSQIEATVPAENIEDARILSAVGFDLDHRGTIFARSIS